MNVEIIDVSEMKQPVIKRYEIKQSPGEKCLISKIPIELLPKEMVHCDEINCERTKLGMTDNCVICENLNREIFIRCKTRYR